MQMKATITAYDSPSVHAYEDLNICTTCVYWAALFDQEQRKSSKKKLEKQGVKSAENCIKAATLFFRLVQHLWRTCVGTWGRCKGTLWRIVTVFYHLCRPLYN